MSTAIRRITDLATLMNWRREVIENVFSTAPSDGLMEANRRYYEEHIADGSHIAVVASADSGEDAGCGAICLTEELPSPDNPSGRCAYLMNIYVRSTFRNRGIGHAIVRWLVAKAIEAGCDKIYLETTPAARPLYISTGFEPLPGIMKYADIQSSES